MSFNLVDLVKDQVKGPLIGQMGNLLGNEGSKAAGAADSMIPALLSGMMGSSSTSGGADSLFKAVNDQDDGLMDNLGSLLGGGQASSVIDNGNSLLGGLLGTGGLGKLAGALAGFTGLSKGGTSSLMGMLAPIVIGVIKRKVMGGGLDAGGLASMLMGQKSNIGAALPAGLGDQLNASGFLSSLSGAAGDAVSGVTDAAGNAVSGVADAAGNVAGAAGNAVSGAADAAGNAVSGVAGAAGDAASGVANAAGDVASGGSSMFRWLLPIVGLAALAWLAMKFLGGGGIDDATNAVGDAAKGATEAVTSTATDAASSATDAVSSAAGDLAGGVDIGGIGDNLTGMFGSATEALGGITDAESATAALPALEGVGSQLSEVSGMMDKVPEAARGPLNSILGGGIEKLQPLVEKVSAIPGVGSIIEPVIGPIMETLSGLAGG